MDGLKVIVKAVAINDREIFGEADYASEREHVAGRMRRVARALSQELPFPETKRKSRRIWHDGDDDRHGVSRRVRGTNCN